jgi:hypothetical protein
MQYPTFQKKVALSAADLNLAMDAIKRARVLPGVGIKLTETLNGTVVSLKPLRTAGGSAPGPCAFSISTAGKGEPDATTGLYNTYSAQVMAGSINSVLPTNWWDSTKKAFTRFDYSKDSLQYVYLDVKADSTGILSCEIKVDPTLPAAQKGVKGAPPTQFNVTLGILFNDSVYPIMEGAIRASTSVLYAEYDGAGKMEATCIWIAYSSGCCSGSSAVGSGNDTGSGGDGSGFGGYG